MGGMPPDPDYNPLATSEVKAKPAKKSRSAESEVKSTKHPGGSKEPPGGIAKDSKDKPRSPHKSHSHRDGEKKHHHRAGSSSSVRSPHKPSSSSASKYTSSSHSHHRSSSSSKPASSNSSSPVKKETLSFKLAPINLISSSSTEQQKHSSYALNSDSKSSTTAASPVKKKHVSHERENASKLFPRTTGMHAMTAAAGATTTSSRAAAAEAARKAEAKQAAVLARLPNPSSKEASHDLLGSIMSEMKKN